MTAAEDNSPLASTRVSVDAASGIGTGISARDRSLTIRLLAAPDTTTPDLVRPGHVLPVRVDDNHCNVGLFETSAQSAADLTRAAGSGGFAVFSHLLGDQQSDIATRDEALAFAVRHNLTMIDLDRQVTAA